MRESEENTYVNVNDFTVSYKDFGIKNHQIIIFIHGFPFNKSMWDKQLEHLKADYRVIAYDIRGFGNSSKGDAYFSMNIFADDLIGFMDVLKIKKAIICGLSMGGYIALNAIGRYPERFEALVLSDTSCMPDNQEMRAKRFLAIENIMGLGLESYADASIKNLFTFNSYDSQNEEIAHIKTMIMNTSKTTICKTLVALSERNETCSLLPEIKVPVHIMVGEQDNITPLASAQLMNEQIKDASLSILSQAGHVSNIENPTEFNDQLRKFADWFAQSTLDYKMEDASMSKD